MRILITTLLALSTPALAAVQVVDGDTIRVDGERVRLWGFDAPERGQTCVIDGQLRAIGAEATDGLTAILAGGVRHSPELTHEDSICPHAKAKGGNSHHLHMRIGPL